MRPRYAEPPPDGALGAPRPARSWQAFEPQTVAQRPAWGIRVPRFGACPGCSFSQSARLSSACAWVGFVMVPAWAGTDSQQMRQVPA